jgi:transcription initiation factor IIE alpha subunit
MSISPEASYTECTRRVSLVLQEKKTKDSDGTYIIGILKYDTIYNHFFKLHHEKIGNLQKVLDREKETIYFECPEKCMRLDFHMGTEYSFKCPECGTLMEPCENRKQVAEIKSTIAGLKAALKKTI